MQPSWPHNILPFQARAIAALSKSATLLAQRAANDPSKIKMLPYDNFNWVARAWESTALHGTVTHDKVSALLVILPTLPEGPTAAEITDTRNFTATEGRRHEIDPSKSLLDILPDAADHQVFCGNAILHIMNILAADVQSFGQYTSRIPSFDDPTAIPPRKTEEYYLPTFDQEQGSTRGNMVVLEHYFGKVLNIPKETFEHTMFTVLGDRLTTVRDRAAQDQRAIDRSAYRFDHLSSFSMVSGLMHFVLNFMEAIGKNAWGSSSASDDVSLLTLRDTLPNRQAEIDMKKVDYYAWLQFLDVILRSLAIKAALTVLGLQSPDELSKKIQSFTSFQKLATQIVDEFLLLAPTGLEALGKKTLKGNTVCGHAIVLMLHLTTLREMQHAIKHGHPKRIQRIIKFWLPMFYAASSYNYANECMELLHNVIHDWPKDYAQIAFNGMLVNPTGKPGSCKPTDI